jgi:hypothetical protein
MTASLVFIQLQGGAFGGGFKCGRCGKIRNTLRSVQRHNKQKHVRKSPHRRVA